MTSRKNRFISGIILIVFSFVIFSSVRFIIEHTDHECSGEDCSFCMELAVCRKLLRTFGSAVPAVSAVLLPASFSHAAKPLLIYFNDKDHYTLISLKVELLN